MPHPDQFSAFIFSINKQRNAPEHLPRIAGTIAELRGLSLQELSAQTQLNAQRVLPALALQG